MKIPMEQTIDNLKKLDANKYEQVSIIINDLVNEQASVSDEEVMASFDRINAKYSDTFRALAQ